MSLEVLVVDDEAPARRKLLAHLQGLPEVEAREASDGLEALLAIRRQRPDLVFLDVQMPGLDGFEVIEAVGAESMPPVVFVTAFDEYALQAFEVEAVDYLLKPYDAARFARAFERARHRLGQAPEPARLERLLGTLQAQRPLERLVVGERERLFFVPLREVTHLSAEGNYVRVHTEKASHLVRDTLARLETRLDPQRFARIHRSQIVALDAVRQLEPWSHGDYVVLLKSGQRLRLSRRFQGRLLPRAQR